MSQITHSSSKDPHLLHYLPMEHNSPQTTNGNRLEGKVVVITGGARGIGEATTRLFALNRAHVVVADILDELGSRLADSVGGRFVHCDVSIESDVEKAVKAALEWKGRLDVMFNNAGISGPDGSITKLEMERVKSLLDVNVYGMMHGIKHAARAMIKGRHGGSIICTSSSAAIMGGLASHAYTMSKEAIIGLMKSSACELGSHGIRVNCISPHGVASEMLVDAYRRLTGDPNVNHQEVAKIIEENGSLIKGRGGRIEDIAKAALFLASEDDAGFITGHNLVVDGGYTSGNTSLSSILYQ
ncbi:hypothetical protein V2J09_011391 [Rumex salicifolius]